MMRYLRMFFLCCWLFLSVALSEWAIAQPAVQWASNVIGFSSEYVDANRPHPLQYRAVQVLHKPNKLPAPGSSPCAWSPATESNQVDEWIHVGFQTPQRVRQVAIGESHNPGAVSKIELMDTEGNWHLFYQNGNITPLAVKGRMFNIISESLTNYTVKSAKIYLRTRLIPGWNHIDAIGISANATPIRAEINVSGEFTAEKPEPLGAGVNTEFDEIFPVISPDGRTLHFDRKNHPQNTPGSKINDDIWVSKWANNAWQKAERMPAPLNNENHNYVCSVTPDGNTLLLGNVYNPDGTASGGVSISYQTANGWSFPEKLPIRNYYNKSRYSEFTLSNNRKVLLLAIERDDSYGDRDLYVSFLQDDQTWSEPRNLGQTVNSAATELTPFLASDGQTLYFSSLGFSGYGSADMFVTRRLDNTWTNWSEPVNMGFLNSEDWDASYTVDAAGEYCYFVSYRNSINNSADIFRARLPVEIKPDPVVLINGTVFDSRTRKPLGAEIIYENLETGEEAGVAKSNPASGEYKITLPLRQSYGFWAKAPGYLSENQNIDLNQTKEYQEIRIDLFLTPLEEGQAIVLNNVFFELSKDVLLKESFSELNRLVNTFLENPTLEVMLEGHTDYIGDPMLNMRLSQDRVQAVKNYLVEKGVDGSRIKTQAFGGTRPVIRSRSAEERVKNRRVEFRILKK